MSYLSDLVSRNKERRNRRALERAIIDAPNPSVRDELILAAQRTGISPRL